MQEDFQHALFPPALRVMGRTVQGLSLWHLAALHSVQSPFLSCDPALRIVVGDLLIALRIVQARPWTALQLRPRMVDILTRLRYRRTWQQHARAFTQWLRAQQVTPDLWQRVDDGAPRQITAPVILSKVAALMAMGFSHSDAWALSPGYAEWIALAHAERTVPGVKFLTDEDRADMAAEAKKPMLTNAECIALAEAELSPDHFRHWFAARQASGLAS